MTGWSAPEGYRTYPDAINLAAEVIDAPIARGHGARIALRDGTDSWTFDALSAAVDRYAAALVAMGIGAGTHVIFRSRNVPAFSFGLLAAMKIGAVPVLTSTLLTAPELSYIAEQSGARLALVGREVADVAETVRGDGQLDRVAVLEALDRDGLQGKTAPTADTRAMDPAFLLYSSGTTGRPKGVLHTHRWIRAMGDVIEMQAGFVAGDVMMTPGEFSFMATLGHGLLIPLREGATVALYSDRPRPQAVMAAIEAAGVTCFMAVPTFFRTVLSTRGIETAHDVSGVRTWLSGGEALGAVAVEAWVRRFGAPLFDAYGISEMQVIIGNCHANPVKPGALGKAIPGVKLALIGDDLKEVPTGEAGTVAIREDDVGLFSAYFRQPEKWRDAFRGGWYVTGDVMRRDEDGYFWFLGRGDDLFKTRGMFVSPQEVEDALQRHPAVAEAGVFGEPEPRTGNRVVALVVLGPEAVVDDALKDAIRETAAECVAPYKVPDEIVFVDALPKTVVGKILRRALPEVAASAG